MSILRIDISGDEPGQGDLDRLSQAVASLPPGRSVVFLLHGYRYDPSGPTHDPHRTIYAAETSETRASLSWVRHLGHRDGAGPDAGLVVAIGWPARGTLRAAYRRAGVTGRALAVLTRRIRDTRADIRVSALGHSLGARVILSSLPYLPPGHLTRAVLLSAAALRDDTQDAIDSPGGHAVEIVNVTSRENDLFDLCTELLVTGGTRASLGQDFGQNLRSWIDLRLDDPKSLDALGALGFPISTRTRHICHWSAYRRAGVFALYRALLTDPVPLPLATLASALPRTAPARWPPRFSTAPASFLLPFRRGASS